MRTLLALALVLAACGPDDRRDGALARAASTSNSRGPDPVIVRIPRDGGLVRAYLYPKLDSVIWTSASRSAPPARVLAFDEDAGSIAIVDRSGKPARIDLRRGDVTTASRAKLAALSSADGWAIYGVDTTGAIERLTPAGDWSFEPPVPARQLVPQADGSLLVVAGPDDALRLLRLHPPDTTVTSSIPMPSTERTRPTRVGDRVYFVVDSGLFGVSARDLSLIPRVLFREPIRALAPTPSGDRIFVLTQGSHEIAIVNRYRDAIETRIALPGVASDLRMDPLGRYLVARAESASAAWIVAVGTERVLGSVETDWRVDLPLILHDGSIALAQGDDVVLVDGETLRERATIPDGVRDYWHLVLWNGFRPRAPGLDTAVTFATSDTALVEYDDAPPPAAPAAQPSTPPPPPPDTARKEAPRPAGFTVSFAALLSEDRARELAASINVGGRQARVVAGTTSGTRVYRVLLGPYPSREEAERVGRGSGRSYWIFEGNP